FTGANNQHRLRHSTHSSASCTPLNQAFSTRPPFSQSPAKPSTKAGKYTAPDTGYCGACWAYRQRWHSVVTAFIGCPLICCKAITACSAIASVLVSRCWAENAGLKCNSQCSALQRPGLEACRASQFMEWFLTKIASYGSKGLSS